MKLSNYTITVPDYPEPGSYLVYNTLTEAMVVLGQEMKDTLDCIDHPVDLTDEAKENMDVLAEMGIILEDTIDETTLVTHSFDRMKHNTDTLSIMVLPTFFCNFKCVYCVEETIKEQEIYMDDHTAESTIDWIKSYAEMVRPKNLALRFYGGEPLMNLPLIERLSKEVHEFAKEKDLRFSIGITTNGALLTEKVVDLLVPYGLTHVKITLDGDKEAHDAKRPYLSGKGTFDRIIKNIRAVSDKVMVNIGGNFDHENIEGIHRLLDFMKETGLGEKVNTFDFKPIMDTIDRADAQRAAKEAEEQVHLSTDNLPDHMIPLDVPIYKEQTAQGCGAPSSVGIHALSEGEIPEEFVKMKHAIRDHGFGVSPTLGQVACAMTLSEVSFIIDPLGKIYNCPPLVGREEFSIGDIWKGLNHKFTQFMTLDVWRNDHCLSCTYVPMCGSGCRYEAYLKTGDIYAPDCEYDFFDRVVPELIKFDYETAQADMQGEAVPEEESSFVND